MTLSAWYLIFLLVFLYPYGAWKSRRRRAERGSSFPRPLLYRRTMITQVLTTSLAIWVANDNHLVLFAPWHPTLQAIALGAAALVVIVGMQRVRPFKSEATRARTSEIAPRTSGEQVMYVGMISIAAFGEEVMYRGALFGILALTLGRGWWPAALVSALAFGLAHLYQGWRAVGIVFVIALITQTLVLMTGTLYVAMALHLVYDFAMGRKHSRRAAALDPVTAPS